MRRVVSLIVILTVALISVASAEAAFKYVGASKCKMCHKTEKQGNQFGIWEASAHAKAFATLAGEDAKKVAAKMEIADPQKSDKCLTCHVTAFGVVDSLKEATYSMEEGVSCEACHGPGSDYKKMTIMKDKEKSMAAGLLIANEETCLKCHNKNSPTYKEFKYEERLALIAHPVPAAEE